MGMAEAGMTGTTHIISVCIANYNGIAVIEDCLRSVLEQEGHISVEILVHDDASDDGSAAYIRSRYPNIKLIESPENVGYCVSNNRMAAAASGKYLLLLNNDAVLYPDALATLYSAAKEAGRPAIISLPQYNAETGELLDFGSLFDPFLNPVPNLDPQRGEVGMVMGACLWIPKTLWQELGGFPEWFGSLAEDMYLCCRARLLGHSVIALHTSGYWHHVGHTFGGGKVHQNRLVTSRKRRALSERNKSYVMILSYPALYFALIFPLHITALLFEGIILTSTKRDMLIWNEIYLPCLIALWQKRGSLLSLRREIQGKRCSEGREFFSVFIWFPYKLRMLWRYGFPVIR